jgi:hypothetical protein
MAEEGTCYDNNESNPCAWCKARAALNLEEEEKEIEEPPKETSYTTRFGFFKMASDAGDPSLEGQKI